MTVPTMIARITTVLIMVVGVTTTATTTVMMTIITDDALTASHPIMTVTTAVLIPLQPVTSLGGIS